MSLNHTDHWNIINSKCRTTARYKVAGLQQKGDCDHCRLIHWLIPHELLQATNLSISLNVALSLIVVTSGSHPLRDLFGIMTDSKVGLISVDSSSQLSCPAIFLKVLLAIETYDIEFSKCSTL